ncbi:hypothetical protein ACFODZ_00195 [Marinicella sediminis]|uniref:DUF2846 domain-containing protein n=2 Tax=Marinicella sediminis TaxID=1792834 RepID=A0ABV7J3J8_9GAMM
MSFLVLVACGSPQYHGYVIKPDTHVDTNGTALLLHAVKNFPIKLVSINGVELNNSIKTSAQSPTYIELDAGSYTLGLSLNQGFGQCGRVMLTSEHPVVLETTFEAGKVYMLQRASKYETDIMCNSDADTIQVRFYIDELPALPYDDVRSTFEVINLSKLSQSKNES